MEFSGQGHYRSRTCKLEFVGKAISDQTSLSHGLNGIRGQANIFCGPNLMEFVGKAISPTLMEFVGKTISDQP